MISQQIAHHQEYLQSQRWTYNALKVREKPETSSQGRDMQAASAPFWSVTPKSIVSGMMLNPMSRVPKDMICRNIGCELRTTCFSELRYVQ
mmetsp:Transcript_28510/g.60420  ORF Transcript_28510/g.60420 Transcript_28510/m.60420 type:complete len:91 (-) Transcript_28510:1747-2019(-)